MVETKSLTTGQVLLIREAALREVGKAMAEINASTEGQVQYYNAMRHFEEALKRGELPG